jgi:hypothetical protein
MIGALRASSAQSGHYRCRRVNFARKSEALDGCLELVDRCLADYDLDGGLIDTWRS